MTVTCVRCGVLAAATHFCGNCGQQLPPAETAPPFWPPVAGAPLTVHEERNTAVWVRLGALLAGLVGFLAIVLGFLAFLVPLIIMNTAGTRSAHVRAHAVESLNFPLTGLIMTVPALILVVLTVGLAAIPPLGAVHRGSRLDDPGCHRR
jgi:uncharacterized protein